MELVTPKNFERGDGDPFWKHYKSMIHLVMDIEPTHGVITDLEQRTRYQMFPVRNHIGVTENKWNW